jgi:hypothetical protein
MSSSGLSQHPADRLIRELIRGRRQATRPEVERIIERMATAPFATHLVTVPPDERGARYLGRILRTRVDSATYHLIKRVVLEEQWANGTTAEQYVEDLRRAVRSPRARLVVYVRRGGHLAATITPTDLVLSPEQRGPQPQPELLVIYSPDRGIIVSGYQFSALEKTGVPQEARWLR